MKHTILIVEDDPLNKKLLSELLVLKGFRIVEACDGKEGVEQAITQMPALILMDIHMPEQDGFGAIQTLKADLRTHTIPVWVLTSCAMTGDEARIRECGCDEYITKPLDLCALLVRIGRHFGTTDQPAAPCEAYPGGPRL